MPRALSFALVLLLLAAPPAWAEEPGPGKTVTVTCTGDPEQRYACYVPKAYTKEKTWPILYCFSPNANGDTFVQRYRKVCEEKGWIVVGSLNSKNGPMEPILAAIKAMWADTQARFSLSPTMRYASGFSGGARVSFALSEMEPRAIAGVIAIGAGLHDPSKTPREGLVVYLTSGKTDPNVREMDPLFRKLKEADYKVQYDKFDGGHVMPPTDLLEKAVRWMDGEAIERKLEQFESGMALIREAQADGNLVEAWRALTRLLDELPDVKGDPRRAAEKLRKELQKDKAVKSEVKAQQELDKALKWIEKNRARIEKFDSPKEQALEKLQRVIDRYPETRAATRAKDVLDEVGALQTD